MRFLALGLFLCLGAAAPAQTTNQAQKSTQTTQTANRVKRQTSTNLRSVTGCVDQQDGRYVLRDTTTDQLVNLASSGNADDNFARFVGHQVQASGAESSGTLNVSKIGQVADMCPIGK